MTRNSFPYLRSIVYHISKSGSSSICLSKSEDGTLRHATPSRASTW
eukprot:CAMPEP_0179223274 /NCGR_PEP_ID=MMETSP0797-20121207/7148_1 /TAXON_ID=47934 /ORGANISM="Dinophysis acuminata, Strain DAEP01" /LENGTH=45 /DNA_ID= /DNA_START= /DNA_END= /DNA_ORIENTATION=